MLRDAWFIARKDLQYMLRRRETLLWTFVMPVAFFYFIGTITGGFTIGGATRDHLALGAPGEPGFLADQLERRLEEQKYQVVVPELQEEFERYRRRLILPKNFTETVLAGEQVTLRFVRRGEGINTNYDRIRVTRAVYTLLADLVVIGEEDEQAGPEAIAALNAAPRALTLRVEPAGERKDPPTGFEQAIPGTMVMFTLLVLLTSGSVLLVVERREGLLRRLASTPISRGSVVLGKWGGRIVLGLVQLAFGLLVGTLAFDMDWGDNILVVLLVLLAYASLIACLGLVAGSLARTEGQALGMGVLGTNVLAALGGCWWPIEITPGWMQKFALFLPTGWAMDALHRLVSFGLGPGSVLPHVLGMLAAALVTGWLAARLFRYQ